MKKQYSSAPKRPFVNWVEFILQDGNIPAVIECKNHGGGMSPGQRFVAWDFDGHYFAINNHIGNSVWQHRENFDVISSGTLDLKNKYPGVPCLKNYHDVIMKWQDAAVLMFNGDAEEMIVNADPADSRYQSDKIAYKSCRGQAMVFHTLDEAKEILGVFTEMFPEHLSQMNPHLVNTRISMTKDFRPIDIHSLESAMDVAKLTKSLELTQHIPDPAIRLRQTLETLKNLQPSNVLMQHQHGHQRIYSEIKDIVSAKRPVTAFEKILSKAHHAVFIVNLTGSQRYTHHLEQKVRNKVDATPSVPLDITSIPAVSASPGRRSL